MYFITWIHRRPACYLRFLLGLARFFGLYTCVQECEAQVFTLFGKVIGTIDTPGLQFPICAFRAQGAADSVFWQTLCGEHGACGSTTCEARW